MTLRTVSVHFEGFGVGVMQLPYTLKIKCPECGKEVDDRSGNLSIVTANRETGQGLAFELFCPDCNLRTREIKLR